MKTKSILLLILALFAFPVRSAESAQRDVVMPTEKGLGTYHKDYSKFNKGFFFAAEAQGGYSLTGKGKGIGVADINLTAGYRFSDYIRIGAGIGPEFYFDNHFDKGVDGLMRNASGNVALSLYANARGNFIPSDYRSVVPYWSVNIGGVFPDGMLLNPSVGIRVGEPRSAFLLALSYKMQAIRHKDADNPEAIKHSGTSFLMLNLGYEF